MTNHLFIFGTIDRWPGKLRTPTERGSSQFSASYLRTQSLLDVELAHHIADKRYAVIALATKDVRANKSGVLSAAKFDHPGVLISFTSAVGGPMSMHCDRYVSWTDNLRAIALALEAMRRIERYGVGEGREQYAGFTAIGSGIPMPPPPPLTVAEAAALLIECARWSIEPHELIGSESLLGQAFADAAKNYHPDRGGSHETMVRINQAHDVLKGTR